jgi:hypothetical protein
MDLAFENNLIFNFNGNAKRLTVVLMGHPPPLFALQGLEIDSMFLVAVFILGSN